MKSYIVVATSQPQSQPQPNGLPSQGIDPLFIYIAGLLTTGLAGFGAFLLKAGNSDVVSKTVAAKINQKQAETNAEVAEKLTDINIEKQIEESRIDQAVALAEIAKAGVSHSADTTNYLLRLAEGALNSSAANAQSTQALSRASESQVQATEDLIKATTHNSEALKALKEAIEAVPKETASILEIHAAESRIALDNIDRRIEESNQIKHEGYERIEKIIHIAETRIIEQYTGTIAQLRVEIKDLEKVVKGQ
jgi:hypothetical protein